MTTYADLQYVPNFDNYRVVARVRKALGFVLSRVSTLKERQISVHIISAEFGQTQCKLSKFLKRTLLTCTNYYYSKDKKVARKYVSNQAGIDYLIRKLIGENATPKQMDKLRTKVALERVSDSYKADLDALEAGDLKYVVKSHRYYTRLQNVVKKSKKNILASRGFHHQYDTECCAPTLLYQHAQHLGMDEYLFSVNRYLQNRTQIRNMLSEQTGIDVPRIKVIINALFSGGRLGLNYRYAISELLNFNFTLINKLNKCQFIIDLKKDISKIWAVISKTDMVRTYKDCDNGTKRLLPVTCSQKWNVYFRLEKSVIDSVINYCSNRGIVAFLEHDGFSTKVDMDMPKLLDHIYSMTGFKIKLDYEFIPFDSGDSLDTEELDQDNYKVTEPVKNPGAQSILMFIDQSIPAASNTNKMEEMITELINDRKNMGILIGTPAT